MTASERAMPSWGNNMSRYGRLKGWYTMTKKELIERMAAKANLTEAQSEDAFKALVVTMTDALKDGDKVIFPGFGTYEVRTRPARMGRNPFTNEAMQIPERRVPAFKPFRALKDAVAMAPRNTAV